MIAAAEGKQSMLWDLQSNLMSLIANVNIPKGKKRTTPAEFNPFTKLRKRTTKRNKSPMLELATAAGLKPEQIAELEQKLAAKKERQSNVSPEHQSR